VDPEQIYAEVLSEEQQKGSAPAVAEGRAKAARARAEAGSPTPKEPKWWPGAQPHFEGGDGPAAEEAVEEPAVEEPAVEEPAVEEPAVEQAPVEAPAPAPEPVAVASAEPAPAAVGTQAAAPDQPAAVTASAPTPVSATAPVPVTATAAPTAPAVSAQPLPSGVSAGTTTGTRLRPEDESATEAQFAGQQAMYERRKLIDELVSTGVPVVTASDSGRSRGGAFLLLLYLLIPVAAIAILAAVNKGGTAAEPGSGSSGPAPSGPTLTAENVQFTTSSLSLPADQPVTLHFDNKDSTAHNVGIFDKEGGKELFKGTVINGGTATDYKVDPLKAGTYYFQCDLHPDSMNGSVSVK
jgi:plastocyanin